MINKDGYINAITQTSEILNKYLLVSLIMDANYLKSDLLNFKVKVLFVGGFNAGKTALINSLLNRDLLPRSRQSKKLSNSHLIDKYWMAVFCNVR